MKVITEMIEKINKIPRADNQIANSDKDHLWEIHLKDELVVNSTTEVSQILLENLQIATMATEIYKPYNEFIDRTAHLETFKAVTPKKREDYEAEIKLYADTIRDIKKNAPYEIRINMFLIQCHDLNNKLIEKCEDYIETIL